MDVWDALSFNRPYRKALPQSEVRKMILAGSGSQFQPECVTVFFEMLDYFEENVPSISEQWLGRKSA